MSKKIVHLILSAIFIVALTRCNAAEDGFNAPEGSVITFNSTGDKWNFPDTGAAGSCVSGKLALATFEVDIPIGVTTTSGDETTTATLEPGNKIHGVLTVAGLDLYKFKEGVQTFLPESSLVDLVASGTFPFVTNERGIYSLVYRPFACYDSDGNIQGGDTQITADVGTKIGILTVSIN